MFRSETMIGMRSLVCPALLLVVAAGLQAESGYDAWLRYAPLAEPALSQYRAVLPPVVSAVGETPVLINAQAELVRGLRGMLGRVPRAESGLPGESAIVLGTRRFQKMLEQLGYQAGQSQVLRDAVNNWFHRASSIADVKGRPTCAATHRFDGKPGWHTVRVQYFDQNDGVARYHVLIGSQVLDQWAAADRISTRRMDSSSSTRRTAGLFLLRPGDEIRVEGFTDGPEPAGLDYIELLPFARQ
jgi:hypothetical protein